MSWRPHRGDGTNGASWRARRDLKVNLAPVAQGDRSERRHRAGTIATRHRLNRTKRCVRVVAAAGQFQSEVEFLAVGNFAVVVRAAVVVCAAVMLGERVALR